MTNQSEIEFISQVSRLLREVREGGEGGGGRGAPWSRHLSREISPPMPLCRPSGIILWARSITGLYGEKNGPVSSMSWPRSSRLPVLERDLPLFRAPQVLSK